MGFDPNWWPGLASLGMMTAHNQHKPAEPESAPLTLVMVWRFVHPVITGIAVALIGWLAITILNLRETVVELKGHDERAQTQIEDLGKVFGARVGGVESRQTVDETRIDAISRRVDSHIQDDDLRYRK